MAYRDLHQTLEQQRISLQDEQRALRAELERFSHVEQRQAEVMAELAELEDRLAEVAQQRHLQALDKIRIASPCNAGWNEMQGDDRARFCRQCSKHVYNLSAMTSEEALALVYQKEGTSCVRFFRRADGTVLTSDCPTGARGRRRRRLTLYVAAVATVTAAWATQTSDEPADAVVVEMGGL
jgi:hypothetical protein